VALKYPLSFPVFFNWPRTVTCVAEPASGAAIVTTRLSKEQTLVWQTSKPLPVSSFANLAANGHIHLSDTDALSYVAFKSWAGSTRPSSFGVTSTFPSRKLTSTF
jgi:hypothetical protein